VNSPLSYLRQLYQQSFAVGPMGSAAEQVLSQGIRSWLVLGAPTHGLFLNHSLVSPKDGYNLL
jgi:hypothetical protein